MVIAVARDFEPENRAERIGALIMELVNGEEMTTAQAAELMGVSRVSAWRILRDLSRVPDLRLARIKGRWQKLHIE